MVQYEANPGYPFGDITDYKDPGIYAAMLRHLPTFQPAQIVEQFQEEIAKLQKEPVPADDLNRVKTVLRASRVRELQTTFTRAKLLAMYELFDNKADLVNTEMDTMMAVTPEQVQMVAKNYLTPDKRVVLNIVLPAKEAK